MVMHAAVSDPSMLVSQNPKGRRFVFQVEENTERDLSSFFATHIQSFAQTRLDWSVLFAER